ncbi:MAG: ATP-binding cassette domain-containing protein [Coriobacteriales bacterium]|nr:ATP-binding cassette domain-containing protein [Coriobacteriales bacterium]
MICYKCGFNNKEDARFCFSCGVPLDVFTTSNTRRYCKVCGAKMGDNHKFCKNCGAKVLDKDTFNGSAGNNSGPGANTDNAGFSCPHCGAPTRLGASFCKNCGMQISSTSQPSTTQFPTSQPSTTQFPTSQPFETPHPIGAGMPDSQKPLNATKYSRANLSNNIPVGRDDKRLIIDIKEKVVGKGFRKRALLKNIKLEIEQGEFVLILGGSGAGKSTFFKAVRGYSPAKGSIKYGSIDVYKDYEKIKFQIGYVPQENLVRFDNTVYNTLVNAASMKMPLGSPEEAHQGRARDVMKSLGLEKVSNNLVGKVSGGQLRRVCIGAELVGDPNLFFLDEPDSGLDEPVAAGIRQDLKKIADSGKTVLAITHSPDIEANLFTRVIVIAKCDDGSGHLLFTGAPRTCLDFFEVDKLSEIMGKINTKEENGEGLADFFLEKWENQIGN